MVLASLALAVSIATSLDATMRADPSAVQQPFPFRIERTVRIVIRNSSSGAIVIDRDDVRAWISTAPGARSAIASPALAISPLRLASRESLTLNWIVPFDDELVRACLGGGADCPVTLELSIHGEGDSERRTVATAITLSPAPSWYRRLKDARERWLPGWPALLLALLLARVALSLHRMRRPAARFSQRVPRGEWEARILGWIATVRSYAAGFRRNPNPSCMLPSINLYRWMKTSNAPVAERVSRLERCLPMAAGVDPAKLFPVNPAFLLHWYLAESLDDLARETGPDHWPSLAARIAHHYDRAADLAVDGDVRELCIALAIFYRSVEARCRGCPPATAELAGRVAGRAAIDAVLSAASFLASGSAMAAPKVVIPIASWAQGSPSPVWPPRPSGEASPPSALSRSRLWRTLNASRRHLYEGNTSRGSQVIFGLFRRQSFPLILERDGPLAAHTALDLAVQFLCEHSRFRMTLPVDHPSWASDAREFLAMMDRLSQRFAADAGTAAREQALRADLSMAIGLHEDAIRFAEKAFVPSGEYDGNAMRAAAVAERVRGEIYVHYGAPKRAEGALNEAAAWFALQGDWFRWSEAKALSAKAVLLGLESDRGSLPEIRNAISRLDSVARMARGVIARTGYADLYRAWALWGEYLLAARARDDHAMTRVRDLAQSAGRDAGFGWFEVVVMRILQLTFSWILIPISLVFALLRGRQALALSRLRLPFIFKFQGFVFLRARRQIQTIIVLANFKMVELHTSTAFDDSYITRSAERHVAGKNLDLPSSSRLQLHAAVRLARASGRPPDVATADSILDLSIRSVLALHEEAAAAPSDSLRRSGTGHHSDVVAQLIASLSACRSVLPPASFDAWVERAYRSLQGLRRANWRQMSRQGAFAARQGVDNRIAGDLALQGLLTRCRDQLRQRSSLPRELAHSLERVSAAVPEISSGVSDDSLTRALDRLRRQLAESIQRQGEIDRAHDEVVADVEPTWPPPGVGVVEYFAAAERACAFVLLEGGNGVRFVRLARVPIPDLAGLNVEMIRSVRDLGAAAPSESTSAGVGLAEFEETLRRLGEAYWPTELHELTAGVEHVYIVPWGDLWALPFASLPTPDGLPLVLEKIVTVLAATHLTSYDARSSGALGGDEIAVATYDSGADTGAALVNLELETASLQRRVPARNVRVGNDATPRAVLELLAKAKWLHVACHGHSDGDAPVFSRLALAPTADNPDGSLYLYQVRGPFPQLHGVFLNACDSNRGDPIGGRPDTLAVELMSAGARNVIATLGPIFDEVGREVVERFYDRLRQAPPDVALCLALRAIARLPRTRLLKGSQVPLSHPAAWWPFIAIARAIAAPEVPLGSARHRSSRAPVSEWNQ